MLVPPSANFATSPFPQNDLETLFPAIHRSQLLLGETGSDLDNEQYSRTYAAQPQAHGAPFTARFLKQ
jgi:hypothetical protein